MSAASFGIRILLSLVVSLFLWDFQRFWALGLLAFYLFLYAILVFLGPRYLREHFLFWSGKILDFLLIFVILSLTGRQESPLIFLIFLPPLETAFSGHRSRADGVTLMAVALLVYFLVFLRGGKLSFRDWLYFFVYLGALGLTGFLALKLSELRSELARQEDIQRYLLSSLSAGLIFLDRNLRVLSWNPRAEEILGSLKRGESLARILSHEIPPSVTRGELSRGEKILGYSLFPLKKGRRTLGWGFLFQDITEAKRKEERLQEAQRLAYLGSMAAGLIHEIKNPLATISGGIEFLKENLGAVGDLAPILKVISRESERLNRLVNNFLFFARPERGEKETFELTALFEEIRRADPEFFSRVEIEWRIPRLTIRANREQWRQIFENLLRNAVEASLEGSKRRVEVEGELLEDFYLFRIKDYGPGIEPEVRARMFEPFFTTKPRGTGLGLAVVYRIVENLKGEIRVISQKGKGTVFEIKIPREAC